MIVCLGLAKSVKNDLSFLQQMSLGGLNPVKMLRTKGDASVDVKPHGILVGLIDRVRSLDNEIIRQDTLIKTILGVPQLIDSSKIAKADRDDQRKD